MDMSTCDIVKGHLLRFVTCHYSKTARLFAMVYNIVAVIIKRMHIFDNAEHFSTIKQK